MVPVDSLDEEEAENEEQAVDKMSLQELIIWVDKVMAAQRHQGKR